MRKIILFFFFFTYLVGHAQDQPSSLQIRMWDNSLFSAIFAGDEGGKFQRAYNVRSLDGGEYYLQIIQKTPDSDLETIFEGYIDVPAASRVSIVVQSGGDLEMSVLEDTQRSSTFDLKSKVQGMQSDKSVNKNSSASERNALIQSLDFTDLMNEMTRAGNDHARDSIGTQRLKQNLFTTAYVVSLTQLFRDESTKLKFAKSAYTRVVDPENYFQVKQLFVNKESVTSLEAYMNENSRLIQTRKAQGLF